MGCAPSKESQEDPAEFCRKKSEKTPTVLEKLKQELKTHSDVGRTHNPEEKQSLQKPLDFCPVPIRSHTKGVPPTDASLYRAP